MSTQQTASLDWREKPTWQWWFLAARPKTLTAAAIPVVAASVLAHSVAHAFSAWVFAFALLSSFLIQIGTNFVNDALDFQKGADTEERLGPMRVTQSGALRFSQVLGGGVLCFLFAFLFAIPLIAVGGIPIFLLSILSIAFGYLYTGGPYPLAYLGLGDLFVMLFFGWLSTLGVYYLHVGSVSWEAVLAGTQIGCFSTVILAMNNLRDYKSDKKAFKKTLAVRYGVNFARWEVTALIVLPYVMGLAWFSLGHPLAAVLPFAAFPLGLWLVLSVWRHEPSQLYNRFFAYSALLHLCFGVLLILGLLV